MQKNKTQIPHHKTKSKTQTKYKIKPKNQKQGHFSTLIQFKAQIRLSRTI